MMKHKYLLGAVLLWLLFLKPVYAENPTTFSGLVTDGASQPVLGATVLLEQDDLKQTTSTDRYGRFRFTGLPIGEYQITISHLGFQSLDSMIVISDRTEHHFIISPQSITLQEVMVEDQHNDHRRREETVSVEVVGADFIRMHNSGSLMHTLRRLPGIQAVNVGSGQSKPLIRGLGFNRIIVAEHGIKHEGQQWGADHALEVDQFAHDHIELIRGAGALAYGSDAIGGVIQLSQRAIPDPNSLSGTVNLLGRSSNQLLGTSVALQGRKRHWFFTSRVTWMDYADARVPADSVDVYSFRVPLYRNRLRNTAGNELNLHFSAGYVAENISSRFFISHVQQQAGFFANAHGLEPRRVDTELYDRSDRDILYPRQEASHFKVVNRSVWDWGGSMLISETGYQNNSREEFSQYVNHGFKPPVFPDTLDIPPHLERSFEKHTLSANIRMRNQLNDQQQLTVGISAEYQDNSIGGVSFLMPAFQQKMVGGYLLHEWQLKQSLRINVGWRYDFASISSEAYHDWFPTQGYFLQRAAALNREFGNFSGMTGVNYHTDNTILRANLGRSFRVPLAKELAANGVNYHHFSYEVGDASLQPETAWQLDGGVEYNARSWSARGSSFVTWFPNYIYLNPTHLFDFNYGAGNQIFNYMGAEVLRWGGEVAVSAEPIQGVTIELSAEYVYSEQLSGEKPGFSLPFSPPGSVLTALAWQPWISSAFNGLRNMTILADARMVAAQNRIVPPEQKTPGFQTFSLGVNGVFRINATPVGWNFMVNNLFNTHYLEHTSYYRLIGVPEPGRNFTFLLNLPIDIVR